ncbi:MAG: UDP-N-acetyl-2-amino-2-deoxyglucuronate dehydrogenase [Candidatus Promineifilaceae bacterium]|jgi:UDP-N-acetyl-2-amino-2-deoxyglucuronate dehydrogenase
MNFGIIGSGVIAQFHAKAIDAMTGSQLHAVYSRDSAKAQAMADAFGCKASSDLDAFLADPALNIVTIATPSGAHLEPCLAAARAGKHVICEKPLEITTERVDQMLAAGEKAGVTIAGILSRRFNPGLVALKKAADDGRFGRISLADAYVKWYRTQTYYDSGAWRGTWELDGGGAIMNQSIHAIDQLLYVAGPVKALCATMTTLSHERIEVEDTAVAILEFESGARGVIQGSTGCWSRNSLPAEVQISGENGSAFLVDDKFRVWEFKDERSEDAVILSEHMVTAGTVGLGANDPSDIDFSGHKSNFEDVVNAINDGRESSVCGAEARKAVALINAIYESAKNDSKRILL